MQRRAERKDVTTSASARQTVSGVLPRRARARVTSIALR